MSSGDLMLMRETAEDLLSAGPVLCEVDLRWPGVGVSRWHLAQGAVGRNVWQWSRYSAVTRRRCCSLTISSRPRASRRKVPIIGSQTAFAVGACGGLGTIVMPAAVN